MMEVRGNEDAEERGLVADKQLYEQKSGQDQR